MKKTKVTIGERTPLVSRLLIIDGISRSGKLLLANLVNGFEGIEAPQNTGMVESVPFLEHLGQMDTKIARELLKQEIDMRTYDQLIGRNLNRRMSDKSSVYNIANYKPMLKRGERDSAEAVKEFKVKKIWSHFVVHEILPHLQIFFDAFSDVKVVSLRRSPVELAYSWMTRYDLTKWGKNPTFFNIVAQGKKGFMPWYVKEVAKYEKLSHPERVLYCLQTLFALYDSAYHALTPAQKKSIHFVRYEDMLLKPSVVVRALGAFLKKTPHSDMKRILAREKLPSASYSDESIAKKLEAIKARVSPASVKRLLALEEAYRMRS